MTAPVKVKKPLEIYRGDTFARTFTVGLYDEDTDVITPVNLTSFGDTWSAQLRATENADSSISLQVDTSQISVGKVTITLSSTLAETVPNKGVWDVQVANTFVSPHIVKTIMRGEFVLIKDVTRS